VRGDIGMTPSGLRITSVRFPRACLAAGAAAEM